MATSEFCSWIFLGALQTQGRKALAQIYKKKVSLMQENTDQKKNLYLDTFHALDLYVIRIFGFFEPCVSYIKSFYKKKLGLLNNFFC